MEPRLDEIRQIAQEVLGQLTGATPRGVTRGLITQAEVRAAKDRGESVLHVGPGAIVTPLGRDTAWDLGISIHYAGETTSAPGPSPSQTAEPSPRESRAVIALGADHGGFELKEAIEQHLERAGLRVLDTGTHSKDSCDYPDYAAAVAKAVALGEAGWGILVDGAGIGSCMAANKVPGVLAATCHDVRTAKNSREHNGANVLCLGSGTLQGAQALGVVDAWLDTPFGGGRHGRRVDKIKALERSFCT
ncbi:MAG: ribose 5-phosphate isomerase B [Planctomycetota bacterium]